LTLVVYLAPHLINHGLGNTGLRGPGTDRPRLPPSPLASIGLYRQIARASPTGSGEGMLGEERFIVVMFVGLRDSTVLVGGRLLCTRFF
jgi:hypothetical protein